MNVNAEAVLELIDNFRAAFWGEGCKENVPGFELLELIWVYLKI